MSKIDKKGDFSSKMANIDSKYDSFIHFTVKFNSRDYSISFFSGIFNSKNYSITFFPGKFNSKIDSKILIWLYSIHKNVHSIRKPGYQTPLSLREPLTSSKPSTENITMTENKNNWADGAPDYCGGGA